MYHGSQNVDLFDVIYAMITISKMTRLPCRWDGRVRCSIVGLFGWRASKLYGLMRLNDEGFVLKVIDDSRTSEDIGFHGILHIVRDGGEVSRLGF